MKKYNSFNHHLILVGIIIPILMFFVSMNLTYAYFTVSFKTENSSASTAVLEIQFTDETNIYANSQLVTTNTLLLPGDTLSASGEVKNSGNAQIYVMIGFKLYVTKSGESTSETIEEQYYSIVNSKTTVLTKVDETYSINAFSLDVDASKAFEINYQLDVNKFNNSYKNATITYELQAYAIQAEAISSSSVATDMLMEQFVNVE